MVKEFWIKNGPSFLCKSMMENGVIIYVQDSNECVLKIKKEKKKKSFIKNSVNDSIKGVHLVPYRQV